MNRKLFIGLGALLVAIVLVQSVFLYRMSQNVAELNHQIAVQHLSDSDTVDPSASTSKHLFSFNDPDWNPMKEMKRMQDEMNKVFADLGSGFTSSPGFGHINGSSFNESPRVAINEDKDKVTVTADIPGADKSNINVSLTDDQLTISATTQNSKADKSSNHSSSHQYIGKFEQSVTLPAPVLAAKMKTDYKDGVLTVTIPKA